MMRYSDKCEDLTTRLFQDKCVPCNKPIPGYEITPNCGYDDHGGRHEVPTKPCKANFFNDGSKALCQPCAPCPAGFNTASPCTSTTDTQCNKLRTNQGFSATPAQYHANPGVPWALPFAIVVSIMFVVLSAYIIYKKRKRGNANASRRSYMNATFTSLAASPGDDLENILSPGIFSAPLLTVLENLDVLEELVILLDPESHGVKNTRHLASLCSFTSTWITFTYSMKDKKSPLKAVLEGVTSKHPDWTVGHLARLLRHMERNDAISVLANLSQ
ncbi:IGF-like family receptor 1 [Scomber japonicus]|uniref:IGF-like family receptor 1 n=1 Tax=Scomber japonicus TaxID=13676 RepID=UPI0023055A37|nr:IGF-like family receptor 1 [Scomber japonicus]